jgi:C1A family cysteine protease
MQKHSFNGYIPSKADLRDEGYRFSAAPQAVLPSMVDLRKQCSPIRDQGQLGSCTCEALVGLLEFNQKPLVTKSVLFPYYNTRLAEGYPNEDSGCEPRDVFKSAVTDGDCANKYWPYYITRFSRKPSANAYAKAIYHVASYHTLAGLRDIKAVLAGGHPVYIGFTVYSSFEDAGIAKTGIMTMPEKDEEILGGHAVLVVGYDDSQQWLIVRNSWGLNWGVKGYFFMPYTFVTKTNVSDMWSVTL